MRPLVKRDLNFEEDVRVYPVEFHFTMFLFPKYGDCFPPIVSQAVVHPGMKLDALV